MGGVLARHLLQDEVLLHLLVHRKDVNPELKMQDNVNVFRADLAIRESLGGASWMREELLPRLKYKNFREGLETL